MHLVRNGAVRRIAMSLARGALAGRTLLAAAVLTVAVIMLPFLRFAYRAPELDVILETANAIIAIIVGFLVYGRFRHEPRLQELLLGLALVSVAVANLVLAAVPDALDLLPTKEVSHWGPLTVRLVGAVLLAGAAVASVRAQVSHRGAVLATIGLACSLVALGIAGAVWGHLLPPTVDPLMRGDGTLPLLPAHPLVLVVQAAECVLYGLAAYAFTRQAHSTRDELIRWVGAGCVLASVARVHYLLFPSLYSEYIYTGDGLRLGFYVFMLIGASREVTSFWSAKAHSAVLEDRRRIARDLHDGLIQELSYIHAQASRLSTRPGDTVTVDRIGGAAARAIDESRRALAALTRPDDADFPVVLRQALNEMASRYDVKIFTQLDHDAESDAPMADALLRITGEAVRNAVRHGKAERIEVTLTAVPLTLTVADNGRGFAADRADGGRAGSFGLTSMRERAAGIGANLTIDSAPGEGTTVRVAWV